jgi:hypothetical protein
MAGDRCGVRMTDLRHAQQGVGDECGQSTQKKYSTDLRKHGQHILAGKFGTAFQTDGQQQINRQRLVKRRGQFQFRLRQTGSQAKHEKQHDGIDHPATLRFWSGAGVIPGLAPEGERAPTERFLSDLLRSSGGLSLQRLQA